MFQYAMTMGMPIMSGQWVERLWEERYNLDITANSESMVTIVSPPPPKKKKTKTNPVQSNFAVVVKVFSQGNDQAGRLFSKSKLHNWLESRQI